MTAKTRKGQGLIGFLWASLDFERYLLTSNYKQDAIPTVKTKMLAVD